MSEYKKGGLGALLRITIRNIGRNGRRTAFCLCAVAIAVFFMPIYGGLIDGMSNAIDDIVTTFMSGQVKVVSKQYEAEKDYMPVQYPVSDGRNWKEIAQEIKKIRGVATILPRISTMATLQESTIKHATLWGVDIEAERRTHNLNMADRSDGLVKGRWPTNANECAVGVAFERKSGMTIGDIIELKTISAQFSDRYWSPKIVGIYSFDYILMDERYIIVDHDRLQRLLALGDGTQSLLVYAEDKDMSSDIAKKVQAILGDDNVVSDWKDEYWVSVMRAAAPIYSMIFLIFIVVASFLICNTVIMSVQERIKEIGMMGCLGMSRGEIVTVFFFESVFLAVIGSLIGAFAAGALIAILQNYPLSFGDLYGDTFADMPLSDSIFFVFNFGRLLNAFLTGVVVASVFTLIPSLKSARVEPVEALRR